MLEYDGFLPSIDTEQLQFSKNAVLAEIEITRLPFTYQQDFFLALKKKSHFHSERRTLLGFGVGITTDGALLALVSIEYGSSLVSNPKKLIQPFFNSRNVLFSLSYYLTKVLPQLISIFQIFTLSFIVWHQFPIPQWFTSASPARLQPTVTRQRDRRLPKRHNLYPLFPAGLSYFPLRPRPYPLLYSRV